MIVLVVVLLAFLFGAIVRQIWHYQQRMRAVHVVAEEFATEMKSTKKRQRKAMGMDGVKRVITRRAPVGGPYGDQEDSTSSEGPREPVVTGPVAPELRPGQDEARRRRDEEMRQMQRERRANRYQQRSMAAWPQVGNIVTGYRFSTYGPETVVPNANTEVPPSAIPTRISAGSSGVPV